MRPEGRKTGPDNFAAVNVAEDYEIRYWTGRLGCTEEELRAAVTKVGVVARDVAAEIRKKK